ncbi:MAG TPA: thioredoxin domain-containing protein, partial [Candidatus Saccharimonadales bacterium]|nr:thioredoxin domain-containing protein [Candidatus Saccharimonadales bacterium]
MSKQFWAVIIGIIVIFVGVFALSGNKDTGNGKATNHVEGKSPSSITLVEYGDYECPFCGQYFPIVKQVQQEYAGKVVFQFRNFPLTSVHPSAFAAARAAEAAALQGKFWQMHDLLYENQSQWSP